VGTLERSGHQHKRRGGRGLVPAYHLKRLASCFVRRRLRHRLRGWVASDQVQILSRWVPRRRLRRGMRRPG